MERRRNIAGGIILILLGAFFIFWQFAPESMTNWFDQSFSWPFYVIGAGLVFILAAIASGVGGLAVPGAIIGGIGSLLLYQNATGDWVSWAYAWVLIPGFVGLGILIGSFISRDMRQGRKTGLNMFFISALVTLALWAAFNTGAVGTATIWAVILIVLGGYLLLSGFLRRR